MNQRGQVFTLDMLFALILVTLVIGCSGQALEQMTGRAGGYLMRFSLERVANDAADVLVKTVGRPFNWDGSIGTLETLGLAEIDEFTGKTLQNRLKVGKLGQLKILCKSTNWDPSKPEVKAAMEFFGGSSNFEIRVFDGATQNVLWHIWPKWDIESSGVENSLEVAAVRRAITVSYGEIRAYSGKLRRVFGMPEVYTFWFEILPGELEVYDWYMIADTTDPQRERIEAVMLYINRDVSGTFDYDYKPLRDGVPPSYESTFPPCPSHGGMENYPTTGQVHEGWNYINVRVDSGLPGSWVEVYVIVVPACTPCQNVNLAAARLGLPSVLELKLWR
ncbi:MAG: hypothetical protein AVW06_00230 [Hadesarchaea archaeon DG-33-1]|nr:MAG: hypothetical protein AVW06_00230 [Hadesarchaea archaeon DG-33-1]